MFPLDDTAILIINFNTCNETIRALSEFSHPDPKLKSNDVGTGRDLSIPFDIVVVDNASTDDSVEKIKSEFPQVTLIENKENLGFASGCNIGLAQIDKSYVLIMNPDVIIKPEAIGELIKFLEYHPDAAAVGPMLEKPDCSLLPSVYRLPTLVQELGHLLNLKRFIPESLIKWFTNSAFHPIDNNVGADNHVNPCRGKSLCLPKFSGTNCLKSFLSRRFGQLDPHNRVKRCEMLVGSCVLFRKGAIDDVGGFDEDFFLYYEEKDLFKRLGDKGYHTYFTPFAKAIHTIGASSATVPDLASKARYDSMMIYHGKHSGRGVNIILRFLILIFKNSSLKL